MKKEVIRRENMFCSKKIIGLSQGQKNALVNIYGMMAAKSRFGMTRGAVMSPGPQTLEVLPLLAKCEGIRFKDEYPDRIIFDWSGIAMEKPAQQNPLIPVRALYTAATANSIMNLYEIMMRTRLSGEMEFDFDVDMITRHALFAIDRDLGHLLEVGNAKVPGLYKFKFIK